MGESLFAMAVLKNDSPDHAHFLAMDTEFVLEWQKNLQQRMVVLK